MHMLYYIIICQCNINMCIYVYMYIRKKKSIKIYMTLEKILNVHYIRIL